MVAVPATADYDAGFNSIKVHLTETMACWIETGSWMKFEGGERYLKFAAKFSG